MVSQRVLVDQQTSSNVIIVEIVIGGTDCLIASWSNIVKECGSARLKFEPFKFCFDSSDFFSVDCTGACIGPESEDDDVSCANGEKIIF